MKKILISILFLLVFVNNQIFSQTPADSLIIVSASWRVNMVMDDIVHQEVSIPFLYGGPQHINVLKIKPSKDIKFGIALSDILKKTSDLAHENNAVAAINGSFFNMNTGKSTCFLEIEGELLDTTTVEWKPNITGAIYIRDGNISIFPWSQDIEKEYQKKKGITLAAGPLLLWNGKECHWNMCVKTLTETKHPRSAVAITKDGAVLLITVDGRFPAKACGMKISELAHLIRVLGGKSALNLDGGGSSTLWLATLPDNGVLNFPCDNGIFDHRGERKVANILYVYMDRDIY